MGWNKTTLDYAVSNINYDKNGNLRSMDQQGVTPANGIQTIDRLRYNYENNEESNRLIRVADNTTNYGLGDFENPNGSSDDYSYDKNGNLQSDANKGIEKISYTHFNKPDRVLFTNGKSIEFSYDAGGSKVQELIKEPGKPDKVTDYIGGYVYEGNVMRYIQTPEGRSVRDINNNTFKEEYFVKDHLGNVRSTVDVVQKPMQIYLATYELASANLEGLYFEQLNEIRDDKPGSINPNDQKSGKLNGQDRPVGTSLLMHVMAGDQVELNVNNYYDSYNPTADNPISASSMLSSIVSTLTGGIGGFQGSEGHNPDMVQQLFQPGNYLSEYQGILDGATDQSRPRAYLNYILFDENMQIDKSFSNAFQVNSNGSWEQIGTTTPLTIPSNGYLAVYLSNQSQGISCYDCATVHFDQLQIRLQKGRQLEESHYYPFGLPMAGLSSAAENNTIAQRRKYQSNEYIKELGLNWMDFNARQYDPQLGRFLGVDPLATDGGQDMFSPYAAMGNAPESMVDPNGMQFESPNGHREINDLWQPASVQKSPVQDIFGGGGNGGSFYLSGRDDVLTIYGANAQSFWAWHIGSRAVQGESNFLVNFKGKTEEISAGVTSAEITKNGGIIDQIDGKSIAFHWYSQSDPDDLSTIEKHEQVIALGGVGNKSGGSWWQHLIGPTTGLLSWPIIPKRFVAKNSSPATTILSKLLSKINIPTKVIGKSRLYTHTLNGSRRTTTNLGRWAGRWSTKILSKVSVYLTLYDVTYNGSFWVSDKIIQALPYSEETKQETSPSHWMMDAGVCFKEGTLVCSNKGVTPIEELKEGDSVLSYNLNRMAVEMSQVEKVFQREVGQIYELTIGDDTIWVTEEHPFYVEDIGWVKVKNLKLGDRIKTMPGAKKNVNKIALRHIELCVYNIEVSKNHNYFVGFGKFLVHNKYIDDFNLKPKKINKK